MAKISLNDIQKRKFKKSYLVWYFIRKDIKLQGDVCIEIKTLYVLYGIDTLGNRQIIGIKAENNVAFFLKL